MPRPLAARWIDGERVLPLLDGLDEVDVAHRKACVHEINQFRRDHGLLPMVVCSRIADYETLGTKLRLRQAILVKPLTPTQVEDYLTDLGASAKHLRNAVDSDPSLVELLRNPLMLSVATLAYQEELDMQARDESTDELAGPAVLQVRSCHVRASRFQEAISSRHDSSPSVLARHQTH